MRRLSKRVWQDIWLRLKLGKREVQKGERNPASPDDHITFLPPHRLHFSTTVHYWFSFAATTMAPSESAARLNFLRHSASFLSAQSPSTAAHLLAVHNQILYEDFKPLNHRQKEAFCGACGSIRKPEYTKKFEVKPRNVKSKGQKQSKDTGSAGATVYKCLRCYRRTVQRKQAPRPNLQKQSISTPAQASPSLTVSSTEKTPSQEHSDPTATVNVSSKTAENASSKKRAKARKQAGLQALLASKQRAQASASPSLDLLDFLQ